MNTRHACLVAGFSAAALVAAGCGSDDTSTDTETVETPPTSLTTTTTDSLPTPVPGMSGDAFGPPGEAGPDDDNAFTYDEAAVPVGATFDVESEDENGRTTVTLRVMGLQPDRDFGVHVHTRPCGPNPSDSGPHYQNQADPAATPDSPSTDPAYANPQNEIWLDLTTDAQGNGEASTTVDWEFRDGEANSVVLHDRHTGTAPGEAGQAGDRLACIDEDF
ncbi:superoxide dismutase family protein [Rhodococcus sp. Z13]|uniref:Superoxide dismutase family protein n=1 Tax=Rhodococcus sacchari TaxID=2962047 RepID=A0ACD4DHA7_9NOCA|nr:superoxide dismutase family protein [Rhodococcus sp. Z13]UYP19078.1 superoxide dismutase family protein [Rhodococcus sp. Z13]